MSEAGVQYWSRIETEELKETRQSLQRDLNSGWDRNGDTQQWLDEIDTALDPSETQKSAWRISSGLAEPHQPHCIFL